MQHYERDLEFDLILPNVKAGSKKQVFMAIGDALEKTLKAPSSAICNELMRKEEATPSSRGRGIAIPEIQLKNLSKPLTILVRLGDPIEYNASDKQPVDIICAMFYPQRQSALHLRRLSRISRLFKNEELVDRIRETCDDVSIRGLIHNPDGWMLAA